MSQRNPERPVGIVESWTGTLFLQRSHLDGGTQIGGLLMNRGVVFRLGLGVMVAGVLWAVVPVTGQDTADLTTSGGSRICYRHTRLKLALCETHELDALVFPYHPGFAASVRDPTFTADDPSELRAARRCPEPLHAGRLQLGRLPQHRRAEGVRFTVVADDHRVPGPSL